MQRTSHFQRVHCTSTIPPFPGIPRSFLPCSSLCFFFLSSYLSFFLFFFPSFIHSFIHSFILSLFVCLFIDFFFFLSCFLPSLLSYSLPSPFLPPFFLPSFLLSFLPFSIPVPFHFKSFSPFVFPFVPLLFHLPLSPSLFLPLPSLFLSLSPSRSISLYLSLSPIKRWRRTMFRHQSRDTTHIDRFNRPLSTYLSF